MTNVPENIRSIWKDVYILFDEHYMMDNTAEAWDAFWEQAKKICNQYDGLKGLDKGHLISLLALVADMIVDRMKAQGVAG